MLVPNYFLGGQLLFPQQTTEDHSWSDKFQLVLQVARKVQVSLQKLNSPNSLLNDMYISFNYLCSENLVMLPATTLIPET